MYRRLFIIACILILSTPVYGQRIKKTNKLYIESLTALLKAAGYEVYDFDIPQARQIEFEIREYSDGQESIFAKQEYDKEQYGNIKNVHIGFYPSDDPCIANKSSVKYVQVGIPEAYRNIPLRLHGIKIEETGQTSYIYGARTFKLDKKIMPGKFIPLVLLGSFWYDERSRIFRFCGESEIASDMSSEILKNLPHYYIVGITLKK